MAPVGRREFKRLLDQGTTCVLVPGGVSECLYMERDKEVRGATGNCTPLLQMRQGVVAHLINRQVVCLDVD